MCSEKTDIWIIQSKFTKDSYIWTIFKVQFIQDSGLFKVQFIQDSGLFKVCLRQVLQILDFVCIEQCYL